MRKNVCESLRMMSQSNEISRTEFDKIQQSLLSHFYPEITKGLNREVLLDMKVCCKNSEDATVVKHSASQYNAFSRH